MQQGKGERERRQFFPLAGTLDNAYIQCRELWSQVQASGFPSVPHGIPTVDTPLEKHQMWLCCSILDLLLQCRHWEGLHDRLCWLSLHLHLLAKHDPDACFCGGL